MKGKLTLAVFVAAFFSGAIFAGDVAHGGRTSKKNVNDLSVRTILLEKQLKSLQHQVSTMKGTLKHPGGDLSHDSLVEMYAHGPAVVTSPALGVRRSADDASDLMVNLPSINEDLVLLKLRQKMDNYANENNIAIPERPVIALSGGLEGQVAYKYGFDKKETTDANLSRAELDVIGEAGPWATTGMIIFYDDDSTAYGTRVSNSALKLSRGFLTIGQLNKLPLYLTVGQIYAPFGSFGSYGITSPSTKYLGRLKGRMVVLGYSGKSGMQAQVYGYSGETSDGSGKNVIDHTGFNFGYAYEKEDFKLNFGGSFIDNLAESDGMQKNIFAPVGIARSETLKHDVPGVDGRMKFEYGMFTLLAEYVGVVRKFDASDVAFNNKGAKPQALNVEGAIAFQVKGKPNTFAVGYGRTWQALALGLPKRSVFAMYNIAPVKNTILGFEYRHDVDYGPKDSSSGRTAAATHNGTGRRANSVAANLGVYF